MPIEEEFRVFARTSFMTILELQAQITAISYALQSKGSLTLPEIQAARAEFAENPEYQRLMSLIQSPCFPGNLAAFLSKDKGTVQ